MTVIGVTGPRGVGKTTALQHLQRQFLDISVVHYSRELSEYSNVLGCSFFCLSTCDKDIVRAEFAHHLLRRIDGNEKLVVLDMHLTDIREGRGKIIQPDEVIVRLGRIVFLNAPIALISQRIKADGAAKNRNCSPAFIASDRDAELEAALYVSRRQSIPLCEINACCDVALVATRILAAVKGRI